MSTITVANLAAIAAAMPALKNDRPWVSVIVPVFNHADYLPACLQSILEQHTDAMELVCIDDASTDPRVRKILEPLVGLPGIKIIFNEQNIGISEGQNRAVAVASGDYLAFVDCDDYLLPGALNRMRRAANEDNRPDYIFADRRNVDSHNKLLFDAVYQMVRSSRGIAADLTDRMIASHLKLIRRDSYLKADGCGWRFSGIQDWELALKIARFGRFSYVPEVLYAHRHHAASVTTSDSRGQAKKSNLLRREYLESVMPPKRGGEMVSLFQLTELSGRSWYCPEEVTKAWHAGVSCQLDARGLQSAAAIEFVIDFNSYFDRILVDRADVAAQVVGSLWAPRILQSPLNRLSA